jgi:dihydrofolate reductase
MRKITIIAAMDKNRAIGFAGHLPWKLIEELRHFKRMTMGKPVIMGRKTFDSLGGKILPGRELLVVSRSGLSLEAAVAQTKEVPEVMVAGGGEIFKQALPIATHMILSTIDGDYPGDVFFPEFDSQDWHLDHEETTEGFTVRYYTLSRARAQH